MARAVAVSPAGLSSFFEICDTGPDGEPLVEPERIGARGGGFALDVPIRTEVRVEEAGSPSTHVFINGAEEEARTTRAVIEELLRRADGAFEVVVEHDIPLPVAAGFGTSGAGALGTALALSAALGLRLTYNQLGRIAHVAEVECRTGLGTVGPLMLGGPCVVTVEPGAPGDALIDRIPVPEGLKIASAVFAPIETRDVLVRTLGKERINSAGREALASILDEPCLEVFMEACRRFALESGLATERTRALMEALRREGLLCAQNMIGEAVHVAARDEDELEKALAIFKRFLPPEKIYVAPVSWSGARLELVER